MNENLGIPDELIEKTKKATKNLLPKKSKEAYGWLLEHTDALLKITIVPRTSLALGFAQYIPRDQKLYTKEELFDRMCMTLGGRAAEALIFNRVTTGAQNDLEKVTKIAYAQVKEFGMNKTVGLVSFPEQESKELGKRPYSKTLTNLIDAEVNTLVGKAYHYTEQVLRKNKKKLESLAETLIVKETLNYDDVEQLLGPPPFGAKKLIEPTEFEENLRKDAGDYSDPKNDNTVTSAKS